jgi:hypothetical protein
MSVIPFAKIYEKLRAENDQSDQTERLFSVLGRYSSAELLELLYLGEEPGFFELMRTVYDVRAHREQLSKQAIEGKPIQPLAEVYERLKELRRQGEFLQLDVLQSEALQPGVIAEFRTIYEALTEPKNASIDRLETIGKLIGSLTRFLEIRTLANRIFGDENKAEAWLNRPNTALSGQRPIDLLKDELGAAVVREMLERIDHGIFA